MRLLNKATKQFEWVSNASSAQYNIISHKWYGLETTLQEFEQQRNSPPEQWSLGVQKIMRCCQLANAYPEQYIWIDTCCIDKTSSAELQEAINSMFAWYRHANCCLVYLDDVATKTDLASSKWFTRGWTLQELLAPKDLVFYNVDWENLGTRDKLAEDITAFTGIPRSCFGNQREILKRPVAERMSWLSTRQTTRVEDLAYCMLGIFDVNISMLYGEGMKAFLRLQREIIQEIDDESVFLWSWNEDELDTVPILAPMPACFEVCRGKHIELNTYFVREPTRMTKRGVEIQTCARKEDRFAQDYTLLLNCLVDGKRPCFELRRQHTNDLEQNQWARVTAKDWQTKDKEAYEIPQTAYEAFNSERVSLMSQMAGHASRGFGDQLFQLQSSVVAYKIYVV